MSCLVHKQWFCWVIEVWRCRQSNRKLFLVAFRLFDESYDFIALSRSRSVSLSLFPCVLVSTLSLWLLLIPILLIQFSQPFSELKTKIQAREHITYSSLNVDHQRDIRAHFCFIALSYSAIVFYQRLDIFCNLRYRNTFLVRSEPLIQCQLYITFYFPTINDMNLVIACPPEIVYSFLFIYSKFSVRKQWENRSQYKIRACFLWYTKCQHTMQQAC